MPKMKSNSGAKKRIRVTGSGAIRRGKAGQRHLMRGKSAKRLRNLRKSGLIDDTDADRVKRLLPYSF